MKIILTVLIIFILIGIGFMIFKNSQNTTSGTNEMATTTSFDEVVEHEHEDTAAETEHGSDAGMEFPTIDAGIDLSGSREAKIFNITGANMAFDRKEIRVKEGDTVTINFTSTDGYHNFTIDAFDAETGRVAEGNTSSVTFVADKSGSFEYYCSVSDHRAHGMVGTFIVE